ncbi:hypothetical protein DFH06DRAFT_1462511 [Mycena polygramma]|nr:hypothetical protein DFH06DRAFT_1462511 [Mycena polygramma]
MTPGASIARRVQSVLSRLVGATHNEHNPCHTVNVAVNVVRVVLNVAFTAISAISGSPGSRIIPLCYVSAFTRWLPLAPRPQRARLAAPAQSRRFCHASTVPPDHRCPCRVSLPGFDNPTRHVTSVASVYTGPFHCPSLPSNGAASFVFFDFPCNIVADQYTRARVYLQRRNKQGGAFDSARSIFLSRNAAILHISPIRSSIPLFCIY